MVEPGENPLLAYARELEDTDRALAAASAELEELRRETRLVRERAETVGALLRQFPGRRADAERSVREAEVELARRREEAAEAASGLEAAQRAAEPEQLAAARRAAVRTQDAETSARARLERAHAALEELESAAARAREEVPRLEEQARQLAGGIASVPRVSPHAAVPPAGGLDGAAAWAARAEAALWVARGGIENERERVIRAANELGASVLGEPLAATSAALVRERLERGGA